MKGPVLKLFTLLIFTCFSYTSLFACSNVTIKAKNGTIIVGRTMEFGPNLQSEITSSPRGKVFITHKANGKLALSWKAKYGYLYLNYFKQPYTVDGMNDKGLSFGYLYLPGYTKYQAAIPGKDKQALPYYALGDWVLSNFKTVGQVKRALAKIQVITAPLFTSEHSNVVFPLHAIITDASGKSIVVEYINGKLHIHNNKLGILTNSPPFNWQLTNLKNYANLSPYSPSPITKDGYTYTGTGQGSGMVGLPGDTTPPSRFIKLAFLTQTALPVKNATAAVVLAEHILSTVYIPRGFVRDKKGAKQSNDETTQWTVIKDLTNHVLYFKSYNSPVLQSIAMDKVNLSPGAPVMKMPIDRSPLIAIDATQRFLK